MTQCVMFVRHYRLALVYVAAAATVVGMAARG